MVTNMEQASCVSSAKASIAIVVYGYGLGNSPSLINMAKAFSKSSCCVDFFLYKTFIENICFNDASIQIYSDENSGSVAPNLFKKIICFASHLLKTLLRVLPVSVQIAQEEKALRDAVQTWATSIISTANQKKYAYFIGVEPLGMMTACILGEKFDTPFIYYNMELHSCPDIVSAHEWAIKNIERSFHGKALFTLTQDEERARIMARENGVANDSFVMMPVCADGEPFRKKPNYLRQRLGLGSDKIIVLYAGSLADWAMCIEIAAAAQSWPDKYVLVFHSHGYHDPKYMQKLRCYEGEKVLFSVTPVEYEELSALIASADIGIALYKNLGSNFTLIGSASGKLAHYLKSGLPVVVNNYSTISGLVNRFNCGVVVEGVEAIGNTIELICQDYAGMREGAFRCYESEFIFSKHFRKVLNRMDMA